MKIEAAARSSPLSRAQLQEVAELIKVHSLEAELVPTFINTTGDLDLITSLRDLGKTDFFTKEVDEEVLSGRCRISIHSAKDLPETIPPGLEIFAITHGVDSSDSLVMREGDSFERLPKGAAIALSSIRRELEVRKLRRDLLFVDIRGPIHARLAALESGKADGVVIAEAALIRLRLTSLNRIRLPGETTLFQGQLAIVGRQSDSAMRCLFACLDSRIPEKLL